MTFHRTLDGQRLEQQGADLQRVQLAVTADAVLAGTHAKVRQPPTDRRLQRFAFHHREKAVVLAEPAQVGDGVQGVQRVADHQVQFIQGGRELSAVAVIADHLYPSKTARRENS
ncbi:hypothetical protein ACIOWK_11405 [Pseudomonas protegens]|uniref:hypothetical protein n=1 Tax=Pseudomonas protegens TaxID=380021 RepID=UPI00381C27DC